MQIMILGSTHFGQDQYHKDQPHADLFSLKRQQEVAHLNKLLLKFKPDMVMIENTPEDQAMVDSLYQLYKTDKIKLTDLANGRSERFQFGYSIAKQLHHDRIFGVDYYESVSNRILTNGKNIEQYQNALTAFNSVVRDVDKTYKEGTTSLKDFLLYINHPQVLDFTYNVIYMTPAKVRNGQFTNPPAQYIDTAYVNKNYIGAEFVSSFYEREMKIYSNIVTTQLAQKGKRLLVIMGQRHAAALSKIFVNDPQYRLVPVQKYLN